MAIKSNLDKNTYQKQKKQKETNQPASQRTTMKLAKYLAPPAPAPKISWGIRKWAMHLVLAIAWAYFINRQVG